MKFSTLIAGLVLLLGSIDSMSAASSPSSCVVTDTTAFSKAQCLNMGLKFLNQGTEEFNIRDKIPQPFTALSIRSTMC